MIAAMYLRKSRAEENAPVEETLASHFDSLTSHAKATGLTVAAVYKEVASGDSLVGRPEMLRLLADLDKYDAVLCMDIDRLGRGTMREQGIIIEALRDAGVLIITPVKTYNLRDDMDDSLISFKALFAREEYKLIRGRLKRGILKTIQNGGYVSNAPYGYKSARVDKRPTLIIEENEAKAVRIMFDLYSKGDGCQAIADKLHAMGYRPHRGDKFNRTSIAKILRNPTYTGKIVWNQRSYKRPAHSGDKHRRTSNPYEEWIITDGLHEPIINSTEFEKVNRMLRGRYHPPYRKPNELKNPLSGVLFCANCGTAMVRQPLNNKKHCQPIILCPTKGCCMSSSLTVVEQGVYTVLKMLLSSLETHLPDSVIPAGNDVSIAAGAKAEISKLESQLAKLHDLLEQGIYDIDTFISRRDDIKERINAAKALIKETGRTIPVIESIALLNNVIEAYWVGNADERNRLIKSAVKRIEYSKPKGSGWNALPELHFISWA